MLLNDGYLPISTDLLGVRVRLLQILWHGTNKAGQMIASDTQPVNVVIGF